MRAGWLGLPCALVAGSLGPVARASAPGSTRPASTRAQLLAKALATAKRDGDARPTQIEAVRTSHEQAERLFGERSWPPAAHTPVYLLAMRGRFTCDSCTFPEGAKPPSGTVVMLEIEASTMKGLGFWLGRRYPQLRRAGVPMRLG